MSPRRGILARLRARLGDERGFTLIEMVMATALGMVVFTVALNVFDNGRRASARVQDRTEVVQRGRTTMETLTKELHSQTCLGPGYPAIVYADANRVTFYANVGPADWNRAYPAAPITDPATFRPERFDLVFANSTVTEYAYLPLTSTSWVPPANPAGWTPGYSATPIRTRVLATNLTTAKDAQGNAVPFFRYYAFSASDPIEPTNLLTAPLSDADRSRTVQILLSFVAHPANPQSDFVSTTFQTQVYARTADPTDPTHSPQCI